MNAGAGSCHVARALGEGQVDVPPFLVRVDLSTECTWTGGRAI